MRNHSLPFGFFLSRTDCSPRGSVAFSDSENLQREKEKKARRTQGWDWLCFNHSVTRLFLSIPADLRMILRVCLDTIMSACLPSQLLIESWLFSLISKTVHMTANTHVSSLIIYLTSSLAIYIVSQLASNSPNSPRPVNLSAIFACSESMKRSVCLPMEARSRQRWKSSLLRLSPSASLAFSQWPLGAFVC